MSDSRGESQDLSESLFSWGAGWVEFAQKQITNLLGAADLEVVNPEGKEAETGADVGGLDEERQAFWQKMQNYIGHDITSLISVPVWIMEPCTLLQRMSEIMEYTELLDEADKCDDEFKRLALILAYAVTPYGAVERPWKPFNPILGETFELRSGNNVEFLAEQVSHHPPIGAAHAENAHFTYDIVSAPKSKFLGNSVEIYPEGRSRIKLKSSGDEYYLIPPTAKACNIIVGGIWVDNYGPLNITNIGTGNKAVVEFTPCGWFGKGRYEFSGYVTEVCTGLRKFKLFGKWNSYCDCVPVNDVAGTPSECGPCERLWTCKEKPKDDYYGRTNFILEANKCQGIPEPLCSDSRRRPDRAALDAEDSAESGYWKQELEVAQRAEKQERKRRKDVWEPRWFEQAAPGSSGAQVYGEEYDQDAVPCWIWKGASLPEDRKIVQDEGTVIGESFDPWQYPELHKDDSE